MELAFDDLDYIADDLGRRCAEENFDTLVGTGLSGALVVPGVARILEKYWVIVRKEGDGSHSSYPYEGILGERWLFVDDRIETGATLKHVREVITNATDQRAYGMPGFSTRYIGSYTYMYPSFRPG